MVAAVLLEATMDALRQNGVEDDLENVALAVLSSRPPLPPEEALYALEAAARLAFDDPDAALKAMDDIPAGGGTSFLRYAVTVLAATHLRELANPLEYEISEEFFNNLSKYLPGAERLPGEGARGNRADGFVMWRGLKTVVEIKRHVFGDAALQQILRYMRVFGAEQGVAVAPRLEYDLPDNIHFVEIDIARRERRRSR